jgi:hypothetical protein
VTLSTQAQAAPPPPEERLPRNDAGHRSKERDTASLDNRRAFGAYLRRLIDTRDLDFHDFALKVRMTPNQLTRVINGTSGTTRERLALFLWALNTTDEEAANLKRLAGLSRPRTSSVVAITAEGNILLPDEDGGSRCAHEDEVAEFKRRLIQMYEEIGRMIQRL